MTFTAGPFSPCRANQLAAALVHGNARIPVEIQLEDENGTVVGTADQLHLVELEDADGEPTKIVIIGRVENGA